jgi:hypothetical protein
VVENSKLIRPPSLACVSEPGHRAELRPGKFHAREAELPVPAEDLQAMDQDAETGLDLGRPGARPQAHLALHPGVKRLDREKLGRVVQGEMRVGVAFQEVDPARAQAERELRARRHRERDRGQRLVVPQRVLVVGPELLGVARDLGVQPEARVRAQAQAQPPSVQVVPETLVRSHRPHR